MTDVSPATDPPHVSVSVDDRAGPPHEVVAPDVNCSVYVTEPAPSVVYVRDELVPQLVLPFWVAAPAVITVYVKPRLSEPVNVRPATLAVVNAAAGSSGVAASAPAITTTHGSHAPAPAAAAAGPRCRRGARARPPPPMRLPPTWRHTRASILVPVRVPAAPLFTLLQRTRGVGSAWGQQPLSSVSAASHCCTMTRRSVTEHAHPRGPTGWQTCSGAQIMLLHLKCRRWCLLPSLPPLLCVFRHEHPITLLNEQRPSESRTFGSNGNSDGAR